MGVECGDVGWPQFEKPGPDGRILLGTLMPLSMLGMAGLYITFDFSGCVVATGQGSYVCVCVVVTKASR